MARLSALTADQAKVADGEWIDVGMGSDSFRIRTRGYTPAYKDGLAALRRQAARDANRKLRPGETLFTPETLPPTADDRCQGIALADHCVLDVAELEGDSGAPVDVETFKGFLREPAGYTALLILAMSAAARVGQDRAEQRQAAEGNSSPSSALPSSGAATPPS